MGPSGSSNSTRKELSLLSILLTLPQPYLHDNISSAGDLLTVGDMNIHIDNDTDADAWRFIDLIESHNLKQQLISLVTSSMRSHPKGH